jgi:hypothetical protein
MGNKTLLTLNHDHAGDMGTPEFLAALREYLARPSQAAAYELYKYGVRVYGTGLHDDVTARGFRDLRYSCYYKVTRTD